MYGTLNEKAAELKKGNEVKAGKHRNIYTVVCNISGLGQKQSHPAHIYIYHRNLQSDITKLPIIGYIYSALNDD